MSKKENKEIQQLVKDRPPGEKETVKVVIRCRPLSKKEMNENNECIV
jgi:hypothetical protein